MLAGQEFATCSDDDFRAYIIGWTLVWSGIIPYTFIASKVGSKCTKSCYIGEAARSAVPHDAHIFRTLSHVLPMASDENICLEEIETCLSLSL